MGHLRLIKKTEKALFYRTMLKMTIEMVELQISSTENAVVRASRNT